MSNLGKWTARHSRIAALVLGSLAVCAILAVGASPARAQTTYVVTVGQSRTFTDCNFQTAWFDNDPNNPLPWPSARGASYDGNSSHVFLIAAPGHAGQAHVENGVEFTWDPSPYTWDQVKDMPAKVTVDYTYSASANWTPDTGSGNAAVRTAGLQAGWQYLTGYEAGIEGGVSGEVSSSFQTTVQGLEDLQRRLAVECYCQAHSGSGPGNLHNVSNSSSADVRISSIKIEFAATGTISGDVRADGGSHSGDGLEGVKVSVPNGPSTTTDASGTYTLSDVTPGTDVKVDFSKPGYEPKREGVVVVSGETARLDATLAIDPAAFGRVSGLVFDRLGRGVPDVIGCLWWSQTPGPGGPSSCFPKAPIPDVPGRGAMAVGISSATTVTTDSRGRYAFSEVHTGTASVTFAKAGYAPHTIAVTVKGGTTTVAPTIFLYNARVHVSIARSPSVSSAIYQRKRGVANFTLSAAATDQYRHVAQTAIRLESSGNGKSWKTVSTFFTNASGKVSKALQATKASKTYYRWVVPSSSCYFTASTSRQYVVVK